MLEQPQAGIRCGYQSLFSLSGLDCYYLEVQLPEGSRRYNIAFNQIDAAAYRQQEYTVGFSQKMSFITLSLAQILILESIEPDAAYENWHTDLAVTLQYRGVSLRLESQSVFTDRIDKLHLAQDLGDRLKLGTGFQRDEYEELSWRFGTSYKVSEQLSILSSWQNEPSRMGLGACFQVANISFSYAVRTHPRLDLSHAIDLSLGW